MNKESQYNDFDPSGVGLKNGNFIGLPYNESTAQVILIPVPWDVTVSYREGTALAPDAILEASVQLDLVDADVDDAWKLGIYMQPTDAGLLERRNLIRPKAAAYIAFLESGGSVAKNNGMKADLNEVNYHCQQLNDWVFLQTKEQLDKDKLVGLIGGDHSTPLGFFKALAEKYSNFGILHIDAHLDLRNSYEGFTYSHASIFNNALKIKEISKLVQVGIRDYCDEEIEKVKNEGERISVFFDQQIKENSFEGLSWKAQCETIVETLPQQVYVSFDIDGLDPTLCPNTGTPVPGGFEFSQAIYLLKKLTESGRQIIGFDACETGNDEWDGNVAARLVYKLCNLMGKSMKRL